MEGSYLLRKPSRALGSVLKKLCQIGELVKFSHSLFALPFAIIGYVLASQDKPSFGVFILILLAMLGARSSAMAFNRIVDADYDRLNPRTRDRHLPAGKLSFSEAWLVVIAGAVVLVLSSAVLNRLALMLSPVALSVVLTYSYSKRITWLSHFWLGLALGIAPAGAWVAVRAELSLLPCLLASAVMFWVAGFDILYSIQDIEFDRRMKLHAIPARFGLRKALQFSIFSHLACVVFFVLVGVAGSLGLLYFAGVLLCAILLLYEHRLVTPQDTSRINTAFFTVNGIVSIALMVLTICDVYLLR